MAQLRTTPALDSCPTLLSLSLAPWRASGSGSVMPAKGHLASTEAEKNRRRRRIPTMARAFAKAAWFDADNIFFDLFFFAKRSFKSKEMRRSETDVRKQSKLLSDLRSSRG